MRLTADLGHLPKRMIDGSRSRRRGAKVDAGAQHELGATKMDRTTLGLDLAKNVFQVHAIGSTGEMGRPAQFTVRSGPLWGASKAGSGHPVLSCRLV